MPIVVAVVLGVLVAALIVGLLARRRKQSSTPAVPAKPALQPPVPMLGLETALDQATDRSGRNMRERIESGSSIDELFIPDDTGPVLRRALDQVEHAHADQKPAEQSASEPPPTEPTSDASI